MKKYIGDMTVNEIRKTGTLGQKISTINAMILDMCAYNKAQVRDEENPDCKIACVYYNQEQDEVYCHFENVEELL